jgi:hypothetical protein
MPPPPPPLNKNNNDDTAAAAAAERKRKRLEAWRKRQRQQQQNGGNNDAPPPPKPPTAAAASVVVSLSLATAAAAKPNAKKKKKPMLLLQPSLLLKNPFQQDDDDQDDTTTTTTTTTNKKPQLELTLLDLEHDADDEQDDHHHHDKKESSSSSSSRKKRSRTKSKQEHDESSSNNKRRKKRWDQKSTQRQNRRDDDEHESNDDDDDDDNKNKTNNNTAMDDALDQFMDQLQSGSMGTIATQQEDVVLSIDAAGSMTRLTYDKTKDTTAPTTITSGGVITEEQLALLSQKPDKTKKSDASGALYTASDWESDVHAQSDEPETDEDEEVARRSLIEALKSAPPPPQSETAQEGEELIRLNRRPAQLLSEVKSEKHRREERLKDLEKQAEEARHSAEAAPEFGRIYNDAEGGVMEEAERNLDAAMAAPDALEVLAELNKKKELKAVDHSKVDYIPFKKNLYIVPRALANLSNDDIADRRAKLKVKVRGKGAPAPVSSFEECGLSERMLKTMEKQGITKPFPVQAQCLPCIMAGRDVIGIAKTGSGKTLAYLLPMLRHIGDQPSLAPNESGPIGLVLAPARELAVQIHSVCKHFAKHLGLKSTAVYGGAGVAEQIADLKRGTHIAVATPGRMIDILTMQSGKILSLQRVSYVVMDEADRMFDMGFAPQISAILAAVRPDRQTVLFSATFPKVVETLARKSLKFPIEVIVGGRSVASDSVTQYAELVEEEEKFLRLLQLLGEHVDVGKR